MFLEPSRRVVVSIAVLELWPQHEQLCLNVRSVSSSEFFFL